jgi:hypothetical protein
MSLRRVLLDTDAIILAEILENKATIKHRDKGEGNLREAVVYTNDIKTRVISTHFGEFTGTEYDTRYSLTLVKGEWLGIPGSGLEPRMVPGEKYVLMLRHVDGTHTLRRAEEPEKLEEVLRLRKELHLEDRRVAETQAKIPDGIYHYSDDAEAQKVRLQDGRRVQIGEQCDFDIVRRELYTRYNLVLLSLTLRSGKPGHCVLMVAGKAYWLFDHHWAAKRNVPRAEQPPRLYCSFNDRKSAEAAGAFFGIAITAKGVGDP